MGAREGSEADKARGDGHAAGADQGGVVRAVLRVVPRRRVPAARARARSSARARAPRPAAARAHAAAAPLHVLAPAQ